MRARPVIVLLLVAGALLGGGSWWYYARAHEISEKDTRLRELQMLFQDITHDAEGILIRIEAGRHPARDTEEVKSLLAETKQIRLSLPAGAGDPAFTSFDLQADLPRIRGRLTTIRERIIFLERQGRDG